jgi:PAS domain S-box-containing protein
LVIKKTMTSSSRENKALTDSTEIILESISDGVFTIDHEWRVTSFNRAAEEITGIPREEALGKRCCEVFRASTCESECALRHTLDSGEPIINKSVFIVNAEGERIPISLSTALLRDEAGKIVGGVETFRDLSLEEELRREIEQRHEVGDMISRSAAMEKLFQTLPQIARSDAAVVIEGETGTGKELLARAVHELSSRKDGPFLAVNCGALPDTLLESELFGYEAGAFTGAEKDKPGRFVLADGGTLFLDEIGDISPAMQVRLLRVLQEKLFDPLGATRSVPTNVRIVAATNKSLAELVQEGSFRQDLYYRINVVRLELPPLRDRKEDISLLVENFIRRNNRTRQNKTVEGITPEAMKVLLAYDYPGNIRELENSIEHAFVLCPSPWIDIACLPDALKAFQAEQQSRMPAALRTTVAQAEARAILDALEQSGGNRQKAADLLGMHKSTLFRKIRALGLKLPPADGRHK